MRTKAIVVAVLVLISSACTPKHTLGKGPKIKPLPKPQPVSLTPVSYLRKLSLHIRGQTPEREEYEQLTRAIEKGEVEKFFQEKSFEYMKLPAHADKMSFRMEELLHVRASAVPFHNNDLIDIYANDPPAFPRMTDSYTVRNSMNDLVRRIATQNLSWDTLLTGKSYRAFPLEDTINNANTGDFLFFSDAASVPRHSRTEADVNFAADDVRVAGILTTSRFFGRYVNTALNKNRKRAAAIFRTFLCDDMKAVVVDEKGNQNEILDKVFPAQGNGSPIGGGGQKGMPDLHGSDPACMKCHYKLDPMGKTFQDSGMILAPLASPGALVYTRPNGVKVNIPVSGVGELGKTIAEQPEYVSCQVSHFWRWFIGEDKPLTPVVAAELAAKFEEVGRKPNDFIAYLVSRPEFGFAASTESNAELIGEVKRVLRNCNGCHSLEGIPSFTEWPIGNATDHPKYLAAIRKSLSLDGSSAPRWMPPKRSSWQPTPADLSTLQRWFDMGAPNE